MYYNTKVVYEYILLKKQENVSVINTQKNMTLNSYYRLPKVIPQLDRLRGLAIVMVLVYHIEPAIPHFFVAFTNSLWIGVDVFFVLSGFLITGVLWDSRTSHGYFRHFYGRRLLRIWPAYLSLISFAFCIVPIWKYVVGGPLMGIPKEPLGLWVYMLMVQNLYPRLLASSVILAVTWSLAIEEQFYIVWPAVIRFASSRRILPCLFAAIFLSPIIRVLSMRYGFSQFAIYSNPLTHGDGLLCGAIIAVWLRSSNPKRRTLLMLGGALFLVGLAAFLSAQPPHVMSQYCSPLVFTSVAIFSSGLLLISLVSENLGSIAHRFIFMNPMLSFFGFISYGLYLYHYIITKIGMSEKLLQIVDRWHQPILTHALMVTGASGISILLAWGSRVTIERIALSKKGLFD